MVESADKPVQSRDPTMLSGAQVLFVGACGVIVVAGLRAAAPILIPFALALILAVLTLPVTLWLQRRRVPTFFAILVSVLVNIGLFGLIITLAVQSAGDFQTQSPRYVSRLDGLWYAGLQRLENWGLPLGELQALDFLAPGGVVNLAGQALSGVASFISATFLVVLILVFILSEAAVFPKKFRAIAGPGRGVGKRLAKTVQEVQEYLGIKTLVSLATGIVLGLWAWSVGLDFPVLLGVIAFVFNYVPTVGSVLASIPAMLLALVQFSLGHALLVGAGYGVVNVIFGNLIEPSLLGRRLGLSTLVVILSLLFWGFVWGPVGMLLAVPLTMVVKIWLENTQDLRWVAILLDKGAPDQALGAALPAEGAAAGGSTASVEPIGPVVDSRDTRPPTDVTGSDAA